VLSKLSLLLLLLVFIAACGDPAERSRAKLEKQIAELEPDATRALEDKEYKEAAKLFAQIAEIHFELKDPGLAILYADPAISAESDANDEDKSDYYRYALLREQIRQHLGYACPHALHFQAQKELGPDFKRSLENIPWLFLIGDCRMQYADGPEAVRYNRRYYVQAENNLRHLDLPNLELEAQVQERIDAATLLMKSSPEPANGGPSWDETRALLFRKIVPHLFPEPVASKPKDTGPKLSVFRRLLRSIDWVALEMFGEDPSQIPTEGP
jgi:hypothetical protein